MDVHIYSSDGDHPTLQSITSWAIKNNSDVDLKIVTDKALLTGGKFLILVSVSEIFPTELISLYDQTFVIHGSNLPKGRGWSPIVWELLSGETTFTMSLIEAAHPVDSGKIWRKLEFEIPKSSLFEEIQKLIGDATVNLIEDLLLTHESIVPVSQSGSISQYPRRSPSDSELDPKQSLESNFDLLRVSDPNRYPAHFWLHGKKYKLTISEY
jgi:methionyl-tRNA formyltransferase